MQAKILIKSPAKILNKAGKARRSTGKILNLAATYGMGGAAAGARLGKSAEDGEELLNNFFTGFSGVKTAIDQSKEFLKVHGYVEDFLGRRRSLPEINMDPYQAKVKYAGSSDANFNPFLECTDRKLANDPADAWVQIMEQYIVLANAARASSALLERKKPASEQIPAKCAFEVKNEVPNKIFDKLSKIAQKPTYMADQPWFGKKTCAQKIAEDANIVKQILNTGEYQYYDYATKQRTVVRVTDLPEFKAVIQRYVSRYKYGVQTAIPKESVILSAWTGKIAQATRQCFNARIQGCLNFDTIVVTKELGPQPIGKLVNHHYTLWDGIGWTDSLILPSGKKQKCCLSTHSGRNIICSPDHRFKLTESEEFRKLSELKAGELIMTESGEESIQSIEITEDYIDMYDACNTERGYFVADGFITHNSAASLTKLAMVDIARDPQLQSWDAQLIIPVHDELLVECPAYYADKVEKRLPEVMINAAKEGGDNVPQACDPYNVSRWASDVMAATLLDEFKKLESGGITRDAAMQAMKDRHPEYPAQSVEDVLTGKTSEIIF